jgi:hypothetical protein
MVQRRSEKEEADSFDKVARLVVGGDPPKWLVRHFKMGGKLRAPSPCHDATTYAVGDDGASKRD